MARIHEINSIVDAHLHRQRQIERQGFSAYAKNFLNALSKSKKPEDVANPFQGISSITASSERLKAVLPNPDITRKLGKPKPYTEDGYLDLSQEDMTSSLPPQMLYRAEAVQRSMDRQMRTLTEERMRFSSQSAATAENQKELGRLEDKLRRLEEDLLKRAVSSSYGQDYVSLERTRPAASIQSKLDIQSQSLKDARSMADGKKAHAQADLDMVQEQLRSVNQVLAGSQSFSRHQIADLIDYIRNLIHRGDNQRALSFHDVASSMLSSSSLSQQDRVRFSQILQGQKERIRQQLQYHATGRR